MNLLPGLTTSPLEELYVSLDLETTGLDPQRDAIIEVGAVKFRGSEEIETFHALVNPLRALSPFVVQLTGISQREVDGATTFSMVAADVAAFLGSLPIVGHSVAFDLAFLTQGGLNLPNPRYDTLDLASVFLPGERSYAQSELSRSLGLAPERPHRALEDARTCHRLFIALVERAMERDPGLLAKLADIAGRSPWPLRPVLQALEGGASQRGQGKPSGIGVLGVDTQALEQRLGTHRALRARREPHKIDVERVTALLKEDGPLAKAFPGYEYRSEQVEMAQAVTRALNEGHHLMVEAGTGVGKSVAYLLPAMLSALESRRRVVLSTNTINLQEQLVSKDIPDLVAALGSGDGEGPSMGELEYTRLKGRGNYLCFRRWANLAQSGSLSTEEAKMLGKTLVWLQGTETGDRTELNIPSREGLLWDRLSGRGAGECDALSRKGVCFLRAARSKAEESHIVVVNHALLLADLAMGGGLIPAYDRVIIDEAHHLEEEASRQFGWEIPPQRMEDLLENLERLVRDVRRAAQGVSADRKGLLGVVEELEEGIPRLRGAWSRLASGLTSFLQQHREATEVRTSQLRVTRSSRAQPGWSELEAQWEGFDETMGEAIRQAERLAIALEPLEAPLLASLLTELEGWLDDAGERRERLRSFVVQPEEGMIYWMTASGQEELPTLSAAPLDVGPRLDELLFSKKESVILTSATLTVQHAFTFQKERIGLKEAEELLLGSPFDYQKAALLLVPKDMPEPMEGSYQKALEESIMRLARASGGGLLVLFTSHAGVRAARNGTKATLGAENIEVLAQGIDGSPWRLIEAATAKPNTVLLGTASFWEGVDLPGELLRVLVMARLPFGVPTEPVFAARSELYADPFHQYALPQAVLRFRQGFGRLIRSSSDRGVVVVLDSRVLTRAYGGAFLNSIPQCTTKEVSIGALGEEVRTWLSL